ncbi:putative glutamyl-endopeptidase [Staphylococcus agnetis]|uniref:trypsin-like serine peptidase n=1 Tax=Staphylococcus agnetis TaxID=985762 RepID=UPI000E067376|nr:serine protease [Staphylococcus agnetis]SUK17562.1 putative glutamyl-endopeptidase [Staphylococcus agnetis]
MRKLSVSMLTTLIILGGLLSSPLWANGVINTNTTEGNHLFTAKFESDKQTCTAVAINSSTYLTAAHCVDYENKEGNVGKVYPALSGISTPLNYENVNKAIVYESGSISIPVNKEKDLAILKVEKPTSNSSDHYLKGKTPNIKGVSSDRAEHGSNSLVNKPVYSIGYSTNNGNNYSIKYTGNIDNLYINAANGNDENSFNKSGLITTNVTAAPGQSGSGLFLTDMDGNDQNDELIGILSTSNHNNENATFALITTKVKEWIEKNSN